MKFKALSSINQRSVIMTVIFVLSLGIVTFSVMDDWQEHSRSQQQASQTATNAQPSGQNTSQSTSSSSPAVKVSRLNGATGQPLDLLPLGNQINATMQAAIPGSSVYIESLTDHLTVSVGKTKAYNSKSLMKTPLVMTMYKAAELGRLSLDTTETLTTSELDPNYGSVYLRGAGAKITLREAATVALQQSDNTAIHVVSDHSLPVMPDDERSYVAMGLDMQTDENKQTWITARSYATVFRCLYTACYLNRENSDALLSMMEKTNFNDPTKLLPSTVAVSHKVGDDGTEGYNDCGVVFNPKKPFIFCIMTASDQAKSGPAISQIIKQSYDFFEK